MICLETTTEAVEEAFKDLSTRRDVAILLINQHVAELIRHVVDQYQQIMPALMEIPSKDHPYDADKDSILKRVSKLCSQD